MKSNGTKAAKSGNKKRIPFTNPFSSVVKNFGRKSSTGGAPESEHENDSRPQDGTKTAENGMNKKISWEGSVEDVERRGSSIGRSTIRRGSSSVTQSVRRDNVNQRELLMGLSDLSADFLDLVLRSKGIDWFKSLCLRDPRYNIKLFFDDVAKDGANKIEDGVFQPEMLSPIIAMFQRSSVFSVWRPT
eukprot:scaffold327938_cov93-Cyclotella_meneghiniana.AAC.1